MFRIEENGQFRGTVNFLDARLQDGAIQDKHVKDGANIAASKLQHQHRRTYAQASGSTPVAEARVVHTVVGTSGKLLGFRCGCVSAPGAGDSVVFDLLVNGSSVLAGQVTVNDSQSNRELVAGTISNDSLQADDVIEVQVVSVTGTSPKGAFAEVDLEETYA